MNCKQQPDIIDIVETWLDKDIKDAEIQFPGYKLLRADRERVKASNVQYCIN